MSRAAPAALRDLLRLLLPSRCPGCGGAVPLDGRDLPVCPSCVAALREPPWPRCPRCDAPRGTGRSPEPDCLQCRWWPPALGNARSAVVLEPPAAGLVHAFKYGGQPGLAPFLAGRMAARLGAAERDAPAVVTWVPTTPARRRRRGYDQAGALAEALATVAGLPLRRLLERTREGPSQVSLPPTERRSNVQGAFAAPPRSGSAAGLPVILVDDVLTTGATVAEAARMLERAGASGVTVLTFARALPDRAGSA